jgi:hypothetical protein
MRIAAETYAKLYKLAAESRKVHTAVKLARFMDVLKTPAMAYGLGLAGLGVGLPLAYHVGQQDKKENLDTERARAFVAGMNQVQNAPEAYPDQEQTPQQQMLGFMPEENAQYYYGAAPGDNDVFGNDNPDFGSFDGGEYY